MPTRGEGTGHAVDTSVAVPAVDGAHAAHGVCREAVRSARPALAGHAAFEVHSVLTRMPGGLAIDAPAATRLIGRVFPVVAWPEARAAGALLEELGTLGITGGSVYDALVGGAARDHGLVLLTRDRRAVPTYDLLGVSYELVWL